VDVGWMLGNVKGERPVWMLLDELEELLDLPIREESRNISSTVVKRAWHTGN
jgi:hypothetical protein